MMRNHLRAALLPACMLAATVASASAQSPLLIPGTHIRVRGVLEGVVTRQAADTLYVLTDEGAAVGISIRQLDVIEISTSVDRAAGVRRGALLGTAAGTAGGLIIWLAGFEDDNGEKATSGDAALFAGAGLVAGIIYGASQGKRVWQAISLLPRASLWPRPGGRVAVAVRLPL